jgi:hypothetical protein
VSFTCSHPCKGHFQLVTLTGLVNAWLTYFTGLHFVVKGEEKESWYMYYFGPWESLHVPFLALQLQPAYLVIDIPQTSLAGIFGINYQCL